MKLIKTINIAWEFNLIYTKERCWRVTNELFFLNVFQKMFYLKRYYKNRLDNLYDRGVNGLSLLRLGRLPGVNRRAVNIIDPEQPLPFFPTAFGEHVHFKKLPLIHSQSVNLARLVDKYCMYQLNQLCFSDIE